MSEEREERREAGDEALGRLLREAADRHLFGDLAWGDELRGRVLASLSGEASPAPGEAPSGGASSPPGRTGSPPGEVVPHRRSRLNPWLGWGGLALAGAAALLLLVLSGPLRTSLRLGSPGPALLSRTEGGAAPTAKEAPASQQAPAAEQQAGAAPGAEPQAAQPAAADQHAVRAPAVERQAAQPAAAPVLAAEARLEAAGVAVALRVEGAAWNSPPPLQVAVIFPGVGERMGTVEGCRRDGDAWSCRALVKDVPDQVRRAADLRVIVLLMQPPSEEGGSPAILAQARDVSVSR